MNTQPVAGLPSLPQPKQPEESTPERIQANTAEQAAARQSLHELESAWTEAARAGQDCTALEDQIDAAKRTIRRNEERGAALAGQLADEQAAARAAKLEADQAEMVAALAALTKERRELALLAEKLAHGVNDHTAALQALCDRVYQHGAAGGAALDPQAVAGIAGLLLPDSSKPLRQANALLQQLGWACGEAERMARQDKGGDA